MKFRVAPLLLSASAASLALGSLFFVFDSENNSVSHQERNGLRTQPQQQQQRRLQQMGMMPPQQPMAPFASQATTQDSFFSQGQSQYGGGGGGAYPYDPNGAQQQQQAPPAYGAPPATGAAPPMGGAFGAPQDPMQAGSTAGGYGAPPAQGGYEQPPPGGSYQPPPMQGYGDQSQGYGDQSQGFGGGFGQPQQPPPQGGFDSQAPPPPQNGFGQATPPYDMNAGAPSAPGGGFGQQAPQDPSQGGYYSTGGAAAAAPPQQQGFQGYTIQQEPSPEEMKAANPNGNIIRQASPERPAYQMLCVELMRRHDEKAFMDPLFVVKEDPAVCQNPNSFEALYNMLVSTIIAQGGSMWRLQYQHDCQNDGGMFSKDITKATIQQRLPNDLNVGMGAGMETVFNMCEAWSTKRKMGIQALGFPGLGVIETPDPVLNSNRATSFRHNVQKAVQTVLQEESEVHPTPNLDGAAVIYLDVEAPTMNMASVEPDYFINKIPATTMQVHIVVSPECQMNPTCNMYGSNLKNALQQFSPTTPIQLETAPSTAIAYARIMMAPTLICPPAISCLLPSMWKDVYTSTYLENSPELYPWFQYMVREAKNSFHLQIEYGGTE